nr:2-pyrone-4,6-dicarbaxylate hydrolase-like isoform X3 [Ipomoea batatas]
MAVRVNALKPLGCNWLPFSTQSSKWKKISVANSRLKVQASQMATNSSESSSKVIDSHLHVWASPQEAADKFPYFPGQEPSLRGHVDFLLECMKEADVDGALIVQPINHKFDHSYVTSVLKKYPSKFVGCCLANPAEDGSGVKQLEDLILKGLDLHLSEIEELCTEFPSTVVLLDHVAFCKPPVNEKENQLFSAFLKLSRFPQVYVKFSALFRVSRNPYPYEDLSPVVSQVVSNYGANRVMWGSDFPFIVEECGYKEAKEAVYSLAQKAQLSSSDVEWIMGKTALQVFNGQCLS